MSENVETVKTMLTSKSSVNYTTRIFINFLKVSEDKGIDFSIAKNFLLSGVLAKQVMEGTTLEALLAEFELYLETTDFSTNTSDKSKTTSTTVNNIISDKAGQHAIAKCVGSIRTVKFDTPPKSALKSLCFFLPKDTREFLVGDICEDFPKQVERMGLRMAKVWVWKECLFAIGNAALDWGISKFRALGGILRIGGGD